MNSFEYFDKIYCINLPSRTDRWDGAVSGFTELGIENMVLKVDGIVHEEPNIGHNNAVLDVINDAKANGYEKILLLEDDVIFEDNALEILSGVTNQIPENWDLLYLSAVSFLMSKEYYPEEFYPDGVPNDYNTSENVMNYLIDMDHYQKYSDNLIKLNGGQLKMTHSLGIKNTMFDQIISQFSGVTTVTDEAEHLFDHWLVRNVQSDLSKNIYMSLPIISHQNGGYSDIFKDEFYIDLHNHFLYKEMLNL
jgi:hypothetical protein